MRNYELLPSEKAILKMAVDYNNKIKEEGFQSQSDEKSFSLKYKLPDCKPPCSPKQAVKQKEEAMKDEFFKDFFFKKAPPCPPHPCPEPSLYCGQDDGFMCPHCPPEIPGSSRLIRNLTRAINITKSVITSIEFLKSCHSVNISIADYILRVQCSNMKILEELYFTANCSAFNCMSVKQQTFLPKNNIVKETACMLFKLLDLFSLLSCEKNLNQDKINMLENNTLKSLIALNYAEVCC